MIYYAFSDYLKQRYGEKVYKLTINLAVLFVVASVQVMKIYHQNYL